MKLITMVLISACLLVGCEISTTLTGNTVIAMQDACYALGAEVDHFNIAVVNHPTTVKCTNGEELNLEKVYEILQEQDPIGELIDPREIP